MALSHGRQWLAIAGRCQSWLAMASHGQLCQAFAGRCQPWPAIASRMAGWVWPFLAMAGLNPGRVGLTWACSAGLAITKYEVPSTAAAAGLALVDWP